MSGPALARTGGDPAEVVWHLLAPLAPYLSDENLFEVVVNRPGEVLTEGRAGWQTHQVDGLDHDRLVRLSRAVASFASQTVDEARPILSATLPGGERIQIVLPPAVPAGTVSLTIRKPAKATFSLEELAAAGLFTDTTLAERERSDAGGDRELPNTSSLSLRQALIDRNFVGFLRSAVKARKNILISGATGSGKTTLSKALIAEIPSSERLITIEDTPELMLPQPNVVRLYYSKGDQGTARVRPKDLLEAALRMRPDRVLLQELRDGTAFYYIRNVNSGHPGSITTVHASSARLAFEQLTLLVKESEGGSDLARDDIRQLLTLLVDVVVQCHRADGKFRVTELYFRG
jgi:type IV secretion system protein VirB11